VPAPLQPVHVHVRGIGQLQEEQLVAGMSSIPAGSEPRDRMWKLSMQSPSAGGRCGAGWPRGPPDARRRSHGRADRGRSTGRCRHTVTAPARPNGAATTSGSKISTPSKPAEAAASSLSSSAAKMQTVASAGRSRVADRAVVAVGVAERPDAGCVETDIIAPEGGFAIRVTGDAADGAPIRPRFSGQWTPPPAEIMVPLGGAVVGRIPTSWRAGEPGPSTRG